MRNTHRRPMDTALSHYPASAGYTSLPRSPRRIPAQSEDLPRPAYQCGGVFPAVSEQVPMYPCPRWPHGCSQKSASPPGRGEPSACPYRIPCGSGSSPYAPCTPAWRGSAPQRVFAISFSDEDFQPIFQKPRGVHTLLLLWKSLNHTFCQLQFEAR